MDKFDGLGSSGRNRLTGWKLQPRPPHFGGLVSRVQFILSLIFRDVSELCEFWRYEIKKS